MRHSACGDLLVRRCRVVICPATVICAALLLTPRPTRRCSQLARRCQGAPPPPLLL